MLNVILLEIGKTQTELALRPGRPSDAEELGRICYRAFADITSKHGYQPDFPNEESAIGVMSMALSHTEFFSVVAEANGRIVGSNFLDERSPIAGVGPITVDPDAQNDGVGRKLMQAVLERAKEQAFDGVRLLQGAYHGRSMALYARLGFLARDLIAVMQGPTIGAQIPGRGVRPATFDDLEVCNELCLTVHGHHRGGEVRDAIQMGSAVVVETGDRISGYATGTGFFAHAAGESNADLMAIIGASKAFEGPGILVPVRNHDLFRWCLEQGLRIGFPLTLMSTGFFKEPEGAYLPSILF